MKNLAEYVTGIAISAKKASEILAGTPTKQKNAVLSSLAILLEQQKTAILAENAKDLHAAQEKGVKPAFIDRLMLNEKRIDGMIESVKAVVALPDPVGYVDEQYTLENGLEIGKIHVPIGTIGIVYEARPNATIEAASLCLKSGNASILRGGSEAFHSNEILSSLIRKALKENGLPEDCVCTFSTTDRQCIFEMLKLSEYIDVVIPRGGEQFVKMVVENSKIPVIKHEKGVCTLYVSSDADKDKAAAIAVNGKVQRPGVCNALENIIFDKDCAFIVDILSALNKEGVEIRGDNSICSLFPPAKPAAEADWSTEYLDLIISAKIVNDVDEAISFINTYGSHHSDAILTNDYNKSRKFLKNVDSAAVYVNASTRFTDGFEFGLGAEIGISTNKIHARGPMGLKELTTLKWVIQGDGQIRG